MNILDSEWLINMLKKSGNKPEARILNAFDILSDWISAPSIAQNLEPNQFESSLPDRLLEYISNEAKTADMETPELLAQQIVLLILSGLRDEIHNPNSMALHHAKQSAQALMTVQSPSEKYKRPAAYIALGIFVGITAIAGLIAFQNKTTMNVIENIQANSSEATTMQEEAPVNPKATADLYASYETMRGGDCQYIEALQIPDADKKVYLENVVGGEVPTNAHDQMIAKKYLQKIRCNYTPMLMKNSTN
jgi:hypothetical protein